MKKNIIIAVTVFVINALAEVTYYEILGVSKQATTQEIRHAYKKLAVQLHPDKNTNKDEQNKFLKVTEAYETLKDPRKRHDYDLYGSKKSYTRKYDYHSETEYDNLYYNGLYHNDPFVKTLHGSGFYTFLDEGIHFINFYSPFCPPCQSLADHWKKLAEVYDGIVKFGAVNCKYYNSFCYNNMRIHSYPTLLLYPHGKGGSYIRYNGAHTFKDLDVLIIKFLQSRVNVPMAAQIKENNQRVLYLLDSDILDRHAALRIAYKLNGLVTVMMAHNIEPRFTDNPETVLVYRHKNNYKEIQSTDEKEIIKQVVDMLPPVEDIGLEKLQKIRNELRNGYETPWVLFFTDGKDDKLPIYQMKMNLPKMNFGVMDCSVVAELCSSLQAEPGSWAMLKAGGAFQRLRARKDYLREAALARNLHSLSASEYTRILDEDTSTWVLLVVPYQVTWESFERPFTKTSIKFLESHISFGIMSCTLETNKLCRSVTQKLPAIVVKNGTITNKYNGEADEDAIVEFIELLMESSDLELSEDQIYNIQDVSSRKHTWVVSYLPADCKRCDEIVHEWRVVAMRLRPIDFVRVGVLDCSKRDIAFCRNIRTATAKVYPLQSDTHIYTNNLQHLTEAPYILDWVLQHIDDSIQQLSWQSFNKNVVAEDLNPRSNKRPWLVYFFSPKCYHCYEMYPGFAVVAYHLRQNLQFGRVNCVTDRSLCQHQHITSYPSIRLYLYRNQHNTMSRVIPFQPKDYSSLLQDIKPHLIRYNENILSNLNNIDVKSHINFKDEL